MGGYKTTGGRDKVFLNFIDNKNLTTNVSFMKNIGPVSNTNFQGN
jgi:hypothetical protein